MPKKIQSRANTDWCLDSRFISQQNPNGNAVSQENIGYGMSRCANNTKDQYFDIRDRGGNNHIIKSIATGKCLDAGGDGGTLDYLSDCGDGSNPWVGQWNVLGDGSGTKFRSTASDWNAGWSNGKRCLDIGNHKLQWRCEFTNVNQNFNLIDGTYPIGPASPAPAVADIPGLAKMGDSFSRGSGYCLDSGQWPAVQNDGSTSPSWGTSACDPNNPYHKFFITDKGQFVSYQSGKCLDNMGSNTWRWNNCNDGANQSAFGITTNTNNNTKTYQVQQGSKCLDMGNSALNADCGATNNNQLLKNLDLKKTFANTGPMACLGEKGFICCPANQVIDSGTIKVGRWDNTTCPGVGVKSDTAKSYIYTPLPNKCIGAQGCTLNWSTDDFGDIANNNPDISKSNDPAFGIVKQFQVSYNCVKNATPLSEITISSLLASKPPWGVYAAESYANNSLPELRGTAGRAATCVNVNTDSTATSGASTKIPFIFGGTNATVEWPASSIPTNFTICSISRYNGPSKARILVGKTDNWLHGHWGGRRGLCHYDTWITDDASVGTVDDWVVVCGKNNGTAPNNILVDGTPYGKNPGGAGGKILTINKYGNEKSDWALSYVFIWDVNLTDAEMVVVSNTLKQYLVDGVSLKALVNSKATTSSPPAPTIKDYTFTFDVQCTKDNVEQTCYSTQIVNRDRYTQVAEWCKNGGANFTPAFTSTSAMTAPTDKTYFGALNVSAKVRAENYCFKDCKVDGDKYNWGANINHTDETRVGADAFNWTGYPGRCGGSNVIDELATWTWFVYYKPKQENYWYWNCAIGPKAPPTFSTFINASGSVSTDNKTPAYAVFSVIYSINFTAQNVTPEMLDALFKMIGTGSRTLYSIKQNSATVKKMLIDFCNAKEYVQYLPSNVCGPNFDIMGSYFSNYSIDGTPTNVFACDDTYTSCQKGWINYCNSPDTFSGNDCQNFYAASYSSNPTTKTSEINPNVKTLLKTVCTNLCIVNGKLKEEIDPTIQSICGCYLPDTIYNGFKATVSQANPSIAAFLTAPQCYFPMCVNNASLWQAKPFECPSATLTQCITNTTNNLNAGGDISNVKLQNNAVQNCSASSEEGKAPASTSKNESGNAPANATPVATPAPAGAPTPKFFCVIL